MQKEKKSECPLDTWMNAKICLPEGERGFAICKVQEESNKSLSLSLSIDQSLIGSVEASELNSHKWNSIILNSQNNLHNLVKGTAILLAPPKTFGAKFWIARINEPIKVIGKSREKLHENTIVYSLQELKRLKNFLEARSAQRISFRTPVLLVEPTSFSVTQYFTHDISQTGLSITLDAGYEEKTPFKVNENYLFQLKLHEALTVPALNYRCVHIREDILTGAKIVGFALDDRKANDPEVEYNLTLLTWSDSPISASEAE
jgi:hypothetical protein